MEIIPIIELGAIVGFGFHLVMAARRMAAALEIIAGQMLNEGVIDEIHIATEKIEQLKKDMTK